MKATVKFWCPWFRRYGWNEGHKHHHHDDDQDDNGDDHDHDDPVQQLTNKILIILFIVALFTSSVSLLSKILKKEHRSFTLRRSMLTILTFGILLLTLFPYILSARSYYEKFFLVQCQTAHLAFSYEMFFFPFVYGIGLVTMAIELLISNRRSPPQNSPGTVLKLILLVFPWVLSLFIVLPMIMDDFDFDECQYKYGPMARYKGLFWIGNIAPALLVLLFAIILTCQIKQTKADYDPLIGYRRSGYPSAPSPTEQSNLNVGYATYTEPHTGYQFPPPPPAYSEIDNHNHPTRQIEVASNASPNGRHRSDNIMYPPLPEHNPSYNRRTDAATIHVNQQRESYRRDFKREADVFVWPAVMFFMCTIPIAVYNLVNFPNPLDDYYFVDNVWHKIVYWLSVCRWLAINVMWIFYWG